MNSIREKRCSKSWCGCGHTKAITSRPNTLCSGLSLAMRLPCLPPPPRPCSTGPAARASRREPRHDIRNNRLAGALAELRPEMQNCPFPLPPPLALACRTRGGKDCIYHLSGVGRAELRGAGQHKIIIHKHEITKSLGTEQQNYFILEGGYSIF